MLTVSQVRSLTQQDTECLFMSFLHTYKAHFVLLGWDYSEYLNVPGGCVSNVDAKTMVNSHVNRIIKNLPPELRQIATFRVEYLNPVIASIGHVDVSELVYSLPGGTLELPFF